MQHEVKLEVAKAKQRACDDLYAGLGGKEGEDEMGRTCSRQA